MRKRKPEVDHTERFYFCDTCREPRLHRICWTCGRECTKRMLITSPVVGRSRPVVTVF